MGKMFQAQKSTASTTAPLGAIPGALQPYALWLPGQFQQATAGIQSPQLFGEAQKQIRGTLAGDFADVNRNPALRGVLGALQAEAARRGDIERAGLRENFGRMGPAFSLDETKAEMEMQRDLSKRVGEQASNLLLPIYEAERGRQYGAAGAATELGQLPSSGMQNILRTIAGLSGGQQTTAGPSKFQQVAKAVGKIAKVAAPIAAAAIL